MLDFLKILEAGRVWNDLVMRAWGHAGAWAACGVWASVAPTAPPLCGAVCTCTALLLECSGSLWGHPVLTVWGGLMLLVFPGSQRWTSLEKSFPDATQNNSVDTVCSAVAICWLLSLGAWFLPRLGVSVKVSL